MNTVTEDKKPKFTPGPLTASGNGVHKGIRCVAITYDPADGSRDSEVAQANARLFAAAPALYEVALALDNWYLGRVPNLPAERTEMFEKACAALALVDGPQDKDQH